jgi:hypothetical protein
MEHIMKFGADLRNIDLWSLPIGTVLRISCGLYDHVAMIGDRLIDGERSVMSFSAEAGGFIEQGFSQFSGGRAVQVVGYIGQLPPEIVMQRARMKRGQRYSLVNFNCEHFVRYAHGVLEESPQMNTLVMFTLLGALAFTVARS